MPKVKPIASRNTAGDSIKAEIGAGLAIADMTQTELANRIGMAPAKMSQRIGRHGDIGMMRLSELWAIRKVFRDAGVDEEVLKRIRNGET